MKGAVLPPLGEGPVLRIDLRGLDPAGPEFATQAAPGIAALQAGGLAAFPTDTVWGIGAVGEDAAGVARIFAAKGRDDGKPLSCLVPSLEWLEAAWPEALPDQLVELAADEWPGATTFVVPAPPSLWPAPRRGAPGMGVRVPGHEGLRALLALLDRPLANSSANPSGQAEWSDADQVAAGLADHLAVLFELDGAVGGAASQVLELREGAPPRVLRGRPR